LNLALVGDVMLGRLVNEALSREPFGYPWGDTISLLQKADFRMCNLECAISDRGEPWSFTPKQFHFRSDAKNVETLSAAHIDAVSLANNHALDYGYVALDDTVRILDKARIQHVGAGHTMTEAEQANTLEINGTKIGLLAFTDNEPDWEASSHRPGVFYVPIDLSDERATHLLNVVKYTKRGVDTLIVSAHWGPNWGYQPSAEHIPFAHALIDSGADIVFGHSGHVFRGIEIYKQRLILYCTGNFVDDYAVDPIERNDQSFVFMINIRDDRIRRMRLYPTKIDMFQATLTLEPEAREIADKMKKLCVEFNTICRWQRTHQCLELELSH
jgi:poly-gamma-glutamate capsule biosynthesis protein CapA/YwtB (metallophosphatase superfamily)